MAKEDTFTHYHQRVEVIFDVVFPVPEEGPGETLKTTLEAEAEYIVLHEHISAPVNAVEVNAMRGPSGSQPIYNNGKGAGAGRLPEGYIEADWPKEE